jgi:hypothetical protein
MRKYNLVRISEFGATFGVLLDDRIPLCLTLERIWMSNERGVSCIPDGAYVCKRVDSPKFGVTFEVMDVPGRTDILFHRGNLSDDSHGCIVLGEEFGLLGNQRGILGSQKAFAEFLGRLKGQDTFNLDIWPLVV